MTWIETAFAVGLVALVLWAVALLTDWLADLAATGLVRASTLWKGAYRRRRRDRDDTGIAQRRRFELIVGAEPRREWL